MRPKDTILHEQIVSDLLKIGYRKDRFMRSIRDAVAGKHPKGACTRPDCDHCAIGSEWPFMVIPDAFQIDASERVVRAFEVIINSPPSEACGDRYAAIAKTLFARGWALEVYVVDRRRLVRMIPLVGSVYDPAFRAKLDCF